MLINDQVEPSQKFLSFLDYLNKVSFNVLLNRLS